MFTFQNNVDRTINYHLYKSKMKSLEPDEEDSREERLRYSVEELSWTGENFRKPICENLDAMNRVAIDARLYDRDAKTMSAPPQVLSTSACDKRCVVTAPRNEMCSNMDVQVEYNVSLTFWLYLVIRVFIGQYTRVLIDFCFSFKCELKKKKTISTIEIRILSAMSAHRRNIRVVVKFFSAFPFTRYHRRHHLRHVRRRGHSDIARARRGLRPSENLRHYRGHDILASVGSSHRLRQS